MKLSKAILKGCKLYPAHSRYVPYDNANGTSTVGAAYAGLVAGDAEWLQNLQVDYEYREFPVLAYWVRDMISHRDNLLEDAIWRLEEPKGMKIWSRERIASWVEWHERRWEKWGVVVDAHEVSKVRGKSWGPHAMYKVYGRSK